VADTEKTTAENTAEEVTKEEMSAEEAQAAENAGAETGEEASGEVSEKTAAEEAEPVEGEVEEKSADEAEEQPKKNKKDKKDEKIEELTDRLQRQMAEFDNFRKRTDKEKASMFDLGAKDVIEKILPVVDNFERGLAAADEADPFVEGMSKIYKQMLAVFADLGVEAIEAEGKEFDPNLHNAVMHVEDESVGENIVVKELQKGYKYKDTVVRHSMVQVAN